VDGIRPSWIGKVCFAMLAMHRGAVPPEPRMQTKRSRGPGRFERKGYKSEVGDEGADTLARQVNVSSKVPMLQISMGLLRLLRMGTRGQRERW